MSKKKKVSIIFSVLLLIFIFSVGIIYGIFGSEESDKYVKIAEEGNVTRYEWMEMLCVQTGITEYENSRSYFVDVHEESTYFAYVQAAVEWGLFDISSAFDGDQYASGRFIALTAMKAIGQDKLQIYLDTEDKIKNDTYIKLAIENGLIEENELEQGFSVEECEQVLQKLSRLYFGEFLKDGFVEVEYQEGVIEIPAESILGHNGDYSKIVVSEQDMKSLTKGNVIVFEQDNTGLIMPKRIDKLYSDGRLVLSEVELEEVVDSLVVSDISTLSFDDIVNYYGLDENADIVSDGMILAVKNSSSYSAIPVEEFTPKYESKGFKILLATNEEDDKKILEISVKDNDSGVIYTLPLQKTVDISDYYYAEVDVKNIYVASQVKYDALSGIQYAEVALDVESTIKGGMQQELGEEKILLCETPVPLGNGIVGVDVKIYLVISADGSISLEAEMPIQAAVRYEKGKGLRNFSFDVSVEEPSIKANCKATASFRVEPILVIFTCVNVIDAEADIGASAEAEAVLHPTPQLCVNTTIAYPIITVSVCKDDDAKAIVGELGLSAEWEIISAEDAMYQILLHYELLANGTSQFVDKCTYIEGSSVEESPKEIELNHTYITRFAEVEMVPAPVHFFDYPDNWSITFEEVYGSNLENSDLGEVVTVSNGQGIEITYSSLNSMHLEENESDLYKYEVSKVTDAHFYPYYDDDDYWYFHDDMIIAKIKAIGVRQSNGYDYEEIDGEVYYAILQEASVGMHEDVCGLNGFYNEFSFTYAGRYSFIAASATGQFTEKEEAEVVAIMSTFRDTDKLFLNIEELYQEGYQ